MRRALLRWLERWRIRKHWRLRLAGPPLGVAGASWWWWESGAILPLIAAIAVAILIDVPFRRSDKHAERVTKARDARRAHPPDD